MRIFALAIILTWAITSSAQRLRLTNTVSGKVIYLSKSQRVQYFYLNREIAARYPVVKTIGFINKITADSVSIDYNKVAIADLGEIGRRRSGSGFAAYALTFTGVSLILSGINQNKYDPCPSCQTAPGSDDGSSSKTISIIGGLALSGLAINTVARNTPKRLKNWKLEVVD